MLPAKNRLTKRIDFNLTKTKGKLVQTNYFGVLIAKTLPTNPPRFGIIVSTKVSKLAVARNRLKRQIRQCVRELLPNVSGGFDFVILVKRSAVGESQKNLKEALEKVITCL